MLRAQIVLAAAGGVQNKDIAGELGCTRRTVGFWRNRFAESGLSGITCNRIRNSVFRSVDNLKQASQGEITHHNQNPRSCVWAQKGQDILEKVSRARAALNKPQRRDALH